MEANINISRKLLHQANIITESSSEIPHDVTIAARFRATITIPAATGRIAHAAILNFRAATVGLN